MILRLFKKQSYVLIGAGIVFFLIRVLFLTRLPIFNDEAIYLRWGQVFQTNPSLWSLPIPLDGKTPGLTMLFGLLQFLPIDPLITGRLLSICFSLVTWFFLIQLGKPYTEKPWGTMFLTVLYALCPLVFFLERMALMESAVIMVHVVSLWLFLRMLGKPTLRHGLLLGILLGFGFWIKTTTLLSFLCVGIGMVWFARKKKSVWKTYQEALLALGCGFFLFILPLLLQPAFWHMGEKSIWTLTMWDFFHSPVRYWGMNIIRLFFWSLEFVTPLYVLFACMGVSKIRKMSYGIYMLLWVTVPILLEILVAKVFTTRYMVLVVPFWVLFSFISIVSLQERVKKIVVITILTVTVGTTAVLSTKPLLYYALIRPIPYASEDFSQYVLSWSSGYGISGAVEYLKTYGKEHGKTLVIVRSDSGNPEDAIYLYLTRIGIRVVFNDEFIKQADVLIPAYKPNILFVSRGDRKAEFGKYLYELVKFRKPLDDEFVGIYRLAL